MRNATRVIQRQRVAEALASSDRLCEGLGHGVVGHLAVAREQQNAPQEAGAVLAVDVLEPCLWSIATTASRISPQ